MGNLVTFKLIEQKGDVYHYEYYIEDKVEKDYTGIFIFNNKEKKIIKKALAKYDGKGTYYSHFLSSIKGKDGNLKESGMGAWY